MTDERLQHQLSLVLRTGISISGGLMLIGFILYVFNGDTGVPNNLQSGWHIFHDLFVADGIGGLFHPLVFLFAGIVVLMLTPIFRVVFTVVGFSFEKDWRYVLISSVVLIVIALSITFSITH